MNILMLIIDKISLYSLDGDYRKRITFYKLAIDKLRRYCQCNAAEEERSIEVCSLILIIFLIGLFNCSL